ncbi:MAG: transposase [Deltaproteobacteria bacterium]|nr:transposase [Deltaproteobacteria bacterium]
MRLASSALCKLKGLISAITPIFAGHALIQRCQWRKRENGVAYVSKEEQPFLRRALQKAYERPTAEEARRERLKLRQDLEPRHNRICGWRHLITLREALKRDLKLAHHEEKKAASMQPRTAFQISPQNGIDSNESPNGGWFSPNPPQDNGGLRAPVVLRRITHLCANLF